MKHRLKIIGIPFLILASVLPLPGQDEENEARKWTGGVSLSMSLNKGNSDTSNLSFDFVAVYRFSRNLEWNNSGIFLFGKVGQTTVKETYKLNTGINWHHSERILSYYRVQGARDLLKNIDNRFIPGLGVGYKILTGKKTKLTFAGGLSMVATEYYDTGDRTTFGGLSFSDEFTWDISESAELNQKWTLHFNLQDFNHALWQFEANLITDIIRSWAVKLTFINSHDSKPVGDGIKKDDYSFLAGISKRF